MRKFTSKYIISKYSFGDLRQSFFYTLENTNLVMYHERPTLGAELTWQALIMSKIFTKFLSKHLKNLNCKKNDNLDYLYGYIT